MIFYELILALVVLNRHTQFALQIGQSVPEGFDLVVLVEELDLAFLFFLLDFTQMLNLLNIGIIHGVFSLPFVEENPLVQMLNLLVLGFDYLFEGRYLLELVLQHMIKVIFFCSFVFDYFFLQLQDFILPESLSLFRLLLLILGLL